MYYIEQNEGDRRKAGGSRSMINTQGRTRDQMVCNLQIVLEKSTSIFQYAANICFIDCRKAFKAIPYEQ
jgi:hypothetical protein